MAAITTLEVVAARPLFEGRATLEGGYYDPTADGQHFLVTTAVEQECRHYHARRQLDRGLEAITRSTVTCPPALGWASGEFSGLTAKSACD
jgi:hypothetical protein